MEILKFIEKLSNNQKILVIGFIAALFLIAWFSFISKVETKINNASEANNEQVIFDASLCLDKNSALEICQLRVEAIEAINAYTQIKKEALKTNPEIWALDDLTALEEMEKEADKYFRQALFLESINNFNLGIEASSDIIKKASIFLAQNLDGGFQSLLAKNSLDAESFFKKALVIDPVNLEAINGLNRALVLDKVLNNLREAELLISVDSLDEAKSLIDEAYELDNQYSEIDEIKLNIIDLINIRDFNVLLSSGYKNLKLLKFTDARTNFNQALKITKSSKLAIDGIILANEGIKKNKIEQEKLLASKALELEDFSIALIHFQNILELEPNIQFAVYGLQEVKMFDEFESNLDRYLNNPSRLSSPNVYSEAARVLDNSQSLNLRKRLSSKKEKLDFLLAKYSEEINITIISDNKTQVTIQNVSLIGAFNTKEIRLTPGKYILIGKRKDFVTVRKTINLFESTTISIQCTERL